MLTKSSTDVLSHVAIRARSQGVLLATCFEDSEWQRLVGMQVGMLLAKQLHPCNSSSSSSRDTTLHSAANMSKCSSNCEDSEWQRLVGMQVGVLLAKQLHPCSSSSSNSSKEQ